MARPLLQRVFPFVEWFSGYNFSIFRIDFISGLTVALVLIPQSMAYAQLAGLPAYYGLYAAFLPPLIATLFGSSRQLATGPVAVVSLMTATALEPIATAGSESFIAYAILLAFMVGAFQFLLGVFRLGLVVNFLSHPVVNGFTNAAAFIIASSQLAQLFGVDVEKAEHHYQTVYGVIKVALTSTHWPTLLLAAFAFAIMIGLKRLNPRLPGVLAAVAITSIISWMAGYEHNTKVPLTRISDPEVIELIRTCNTFHEDIDIISQVRVIRNEKIKELGNDQGPHSIEIVKLRQQISLLSLEIEALRQKLAEQRSALRKIRLVADTGEGSDVRFLRAGPMMPGGKSGEKWRIKVGNTRIDEAAVTLMAGGVVVGSVPPGLPGLKAPSLDLSDMLSLLSMAVVISLLGFMEAISIAKAMAAKTGQRLDPNQELVGQGLANIVGSFSQSYPVSGSFSRSAVNLQSGARTGLSNVFGSGFVAVTLLLFTPLLYYLPQAVLAAIIMMAVISLVNVRGFVHAWRAQKYDGVIGIVTFVTTLAFAPHLDRGILTGVTLSLGLYLLRVMKPAIASLSLYTDGTYRNADRLLLEKCRHIAVIRYNGSLFFANVKYLEDKILEQVASMPDLRHVLIVGNGINELDASGEEMLSLLVDKLRNSGFDISISGLNDSVLDVMRRTYLYEKIDENHLYRNATRAIEGIYKRAHQDSDERTCPLMEVCFFPQSPTYPSQ